MTVDEECSSGGGGGPLHVHNRQSIKDAIRANHALIDTWVSGPVVGPNS